MPDGASSYDFDVVVLGGGPAGCATALSVAHRGVFRVLLAEPTRPGGLRIGESVPPDIGTPLDELGLWGEFLAEKHEPCLGGCSSWGADDLGYNDSLFSPLGNGWQLDRARFDRFLLRKAEERGAEIAREMRFGSCERLGRGGFRIGLVGREGRARTVSTRFVVDATGPRSCFARGMGARRDHIDQLICVVAFFQLPGQAVFSRLTILEAVEYGWWYAGGLPDAKVAVVAASDPQIVKQTGLHRCDRWLERLATTRHISLALSGCRLIVDSKSACVGPSFLLDKVAGDGWLAAGDAASAFDPISSRGIHKALSDGCRAGRAIAGHLRREDGRLDEYQAFVASRFQRYLHGRSYFYGLEKRWPDSLFWRRRRPT